MYRVTAKATANGGAVDLALNDPADWLDPPYPMGQLKMTVALLGDDERGPFAALWCDGARTKPMPVTPGHGHGSDSWRVSIKGSMRMGAQCLDQGRFRFQKGGRPYGADNVSWGGEGGYSVVMMGDRRGGSAFPAREEDRPRFSPVTSRMFNDWLGIDTWGDFQEAQGLATTLGPVRAGFATGSYADEWPHLVSGVEFVAGLLGDPEFGPVVLLTKAAAGETPFPALRLATEVMHVVVRGHGTQGDIALPEFHVRIIEADVTGEPIVAGSDGLWLASIFGNRRALADAITNEAGEHWLTRLKATTEELQRQLV